MGRCSCNRTATQPHRKAITTVPVGQLASALTQQLKPGQPSGLGGGRGVGGAGDGDHRLGVLNRGLAVAGLKGHNHRPRSGGNRGHGGAVTSPCSDESSTEQAAWIAALRAEAHSRWALMDQAIGAPACSRSAKARASWASRCSWATRSLTSRCTDTQWVCQPVGSARGATFRSIQQVEPSRR